MKTFKEHRKTLEERFLNLFYSDEAKREEYADEVWDILTRSYSSIGGLKIKGLESKSEMIKEIPFWKIAKKGSKVVAVSLYKDKKGRKRVAIGTDGSSEGKNALIEIYEEDFKRAYFEVSGPSLGFILKTLGEGFITKHLKTPEEASRILGKELPKIGKDDERSPEISKFLSKYRWIRKYFYKRELGGKTYYKVMMGSSGKTIR